MYSNKISFLYIKCMLTHKVQKIVKTFFKNMVGMPFKTSNIFKISDSQIWNIIFLKNDSICSCIF